MESFLVSTGLVAIAEIGDKTQLLAMMLAARFRRPVPIVLGILLATLLNHGLAAWLGGIAAAWLGPDWMRWILGALFIAMAAWTLIPDKADDGPSQASRFGAFLATLVAFFLVEIGDKTQIATIALAARFESIVLVTLGTTLGMMIANVPAVFCGELIAKHVNFTIIRVIAAISFAVLGALVLLEVNLGLFG